MALLGLPHQPSQLLGWLLVFLHVLIVKDMLEILKPAVELIEVEDILSTKVGQQGVQFGRHEYLNCTFEYEHSLQQPPHIKLLVDLFC